MERTVVTNSLLCFISNFRSNPHVKGLVAKFFTQSQNTEARELLAACLNDNGRKILSSTSDIFDLYDAVHDQTKPPCFAAVDLTNMPLVLLTKEGHESQTLMEVKGLRAYIEDALDGRIEETRAITPVNIINKVVDSPTPEAAVEVPQQPQVQTSSVTITTDMLLTMPSSSPAFELPKPVISSCLSPKITTPTTPNLVWQPPTQEEVEESKPTLPATPSRRRAARSLDETVTKLRKKATKSQSPDPSINPLQYKNPLDQQLQYMLRMMNPGIVHPVFNIIGQQMAAANRQFGNNERDEKIDDMGEEDECSPSPSGSTKDNCNEMDNLENDSDKPFVCNHPHCNKKFANKFLLKKHQFIHTGLKPHTCPYCKKTFNRKDNLLRHKKTHMECAMEDQGIHPIGLPSTPILFPPFAAAALEGLRMESSNDGIEGKEEDDEENFLSDNSFVIPNEQESIKGN